MVFSTLTFVYFFLPICLILYFSMRTIRSKNTVLLVMSLIFYAWGEPLWLILMLITAFINYLCGLMIGKYKSDKFLSRLWMTVSVIASLGSLALFKYTGFVIKNLNLLPFVHLNDWSLSLPIGISFYTFQSLSYTIDVYRGNTEVQRSYPDFLLYVSLFPQLIAGPIVRYSDVALEISQRKTSLQDFSKGITRFITGLSKKLLLANYCGELIEKYMNSQTFVGSWIGIILFAFQIYFDFSGYSDMAIGIGRILGFHFKENFDYPYCCDSITSFWRRWHISLSSFFKDYVYIPLGGNRKHAIRNLLIVWGLTGLWHGASWNFILWGLYFGVLLILEKYVLKNYIEKCNVVIRRIISLFLVLIGWAIFYFENLSDLGKFLFSAFGGAPKFCTADIGKQLLSNLLLFVFCIMASVPVGKILHNLNISLRKKRGIGRTVAFVSTLGYDTLLLFISTMVMVSNTYNPFLYFRF